MLDRLRNRAVERPVRQGVWMTAWALLAFVLSFRPGYTWDDVLFATCFSGLASILIVDMLLTGLEA